MKKLLIACCVFALMACQNKEAEKAQVQKPQLDKQILELVKFMNDSVSGCGQWLSKDYRIRHFLDGSDTAIDAFERKFTHDDILDIYEGAEAMTMMDFAPYLDSLDIPFVSHIDSVENCASALNAAAFLRNGQRALVLFVKVEDNIVRTNSFLLQKQKQHWAIMDTLRENVHPRETF